VNYSFGIKVFNYLPPSIKRLIDNINQFKSALIFIYTLIPSALQMTIIMYSKQKTLKLILYINFKLILFRINKVPCLLIHCNLSCVQRY